MRRKLMHYIAAAIILIYLSIPLAVTFLYSIAQKWQSSVLPESYTIAWYQAVLSDIRFWNALGRSFFISIASVILCLAVMIPTVFIITMYLKKYEKYIEIISIIPFSIPGVVYAVGLIRIYSKGPVNIGGTVWILLGAFFIVVMPYMYQAVRNCLMTIDARQLMEAAELLNATKLQAFVHVILPNIMKGITVSALLAFSLLFGEFVLTNILVGGAFETVQIYLFTKQNFSGHLCSAIVIMYFICVLVLSLLTTTANKLISGRSRGGIQ
ncbi:MAG: transporter permease [Firmicutes bacterium]|nr:transporter permease [Bacillota bacterium]